MHEKCILLVKEYALELGNWILCGFIKKTMKTPRSEIVNAKKCRDDYIRRYKHEI